jgi:hypothetical protein
MFEVLTAEKMSIMVFWVVTPCVLVGGYQRLALFALKKEAMRSSETLVTPYKTSRRHNPEGHDRQKIYCLTDIWV